MDPMLLQLLMGQIGQGGTPGAGTAPDGMPTAPGGSPLASALGSLGQMPATPEGPYPPQPVFPEAGRALNPAFSQQLLQQLMMMSTGPRPTTLGATLAGR